MQRQCIVELFMTCISKWSINLIPYRLNNDVDVDVDVVVDVSLSH